MIKTWFHKYITTLFVLAALMGVFHHHNDMQVHEDCQICTVQSNIVDADIPSPTQYIFFAKLTLTGVSYIKNPHLYQTFTSVQARSPPEYS